jgi:hypothetical protein
VLNKIGDHSTGKFVVLNGRADHAANSLPLGAKGKYFLKKSLPSVYGLPANIKQLLKSGFIVFLWIILQ